MAWVKLDDQAPRNAKMLKAGPAACWLWVCGIAHSQSQLTDGFISAEALPMIGVVGLGKARKLADVLVEAGLFEKVAGGFRVHHYLEFNDSRETALAKRAELAATRAAAGRVGGQRSGAVRSTEATKQTGSKPEANTQANDRSPIPSHPIPTVPDQKTTAAERAPESRSKRPIYTSDRFAVFEWQLDELAKILGSHYEDFDLHAFFDGLTQQSRAGGLVIARADVWPWLQVQVIDEAKRRGFPFAGAKNSAADDARAVAKLLGIDPEKAGIPS